MPAKRDTSRRGSRQSRTSLEGRQGLAIHPQLARHYGTLPSRLYNHPRLVQASRVQSVRSEVALKTLHQTSVPRLQCAPDEPDRMAVSQECFPTAVPPPLLPQEPERTAEATVVEMRPVGDKLP